MTTTAEASAAPEPHARIGLLPPRTRLIALSFLMLFVELALIRWSGSNVLYLSYFSNFVLLGSFLGIGLGFLRANHRVNLFPFAPLALAGLVAFIWFFPVEVRNTGSQLIYFGDLTSTGPPRELVLAVIFVAVAAAMAFIGEGVARTFALFTPLEAYKWDLVGSVLGILGFTIMSFLRAPPLAWGIISAIVFVAVYLPKIEWYQVAALAVILLILGVESFAANTSWSPYYKITEEPTDAPDDGNAVKIAVNGVPHQAETRAASNPLYTGVYERLQGLPLDDVLIIGAGSGNDVSVALANGAGRVDAVEIDPRIREIGGSTHPDRPYDDERVVTHINDGRAFLENTDREYDLVLLALPDSITLVQGQSSLRLESYLFTKEAIEAARDVLKPGGVFAMYNFYRENWLVDRYANTLREVFGNPPCETRLGPEDARQQLAVLVVSEDPSSVRCEPGETSAAVWKASTSIEDPATDDHPFPYLRGRTLPSFYTVVILLILVFSIIAVRVVGGPLRGMVRFADLFFMGAAFLLLQTKSVVQFALLFGTTWLVNALVFLGVLLSVLVAVILSQRVSFKHPARLYVVLLAALVVAFVIPPSALLGLPAVPRFFAATVLAFFPIFTANLVFTSRFKATSHQTTAFGANLLGAMVGGLLEYTSLIIGYRSLLVMVALLYGLAFLTGRRHLGVGVAAPA